jgi:hypothetical protein
MAFIGNSVQNQGFTPAIDYFNGNGVTVTFTLSRPIASVAQLIVAIDNVIQNPSSSFTVAGNAITFSSAPLSGTNNIWVEYTSLITTYQGISQDPTVIGDIRATGGYLAEGDFGNSFVDGAILDYVTGLGRITVGDADGLAIYNGGTAARTALMTVGATGQTTINSSSSASAVILNSTNAGGTALNIQNSGTVNSLLGGYNSIVGSGNATDVMLSATQGVLAFGTGASSTERMRINAAGQITTPFQPAFSGGIVGASGNVTANPLVFNSALLNQGSHYNTSTGLFTCPVAGVYRVSCSTTTYINGYVAVNITLRKNGSDIDVAYGKGYWEGSLSASYLGKSASWLISCAANDNIAVGGTVYREPTASYCTLTIELVG